MKASDLLVKALENEGVKTIYGIPGEENLDFLDSLSRSGIELVLTRHEQAAGFMAATYGRLTGEPGVCLSTLGPGATNFVTAAADQKEQAGSLPDRRCGASHGSCNEILTTSCRWRQHPLDDP